jgi:hypothetical protein
MPTSRSHRRRSRSDAVRRREQSRRYHEARRLATSSAADDVAARMSATDWDDLRACADAEARGDAVEALRRYSSISHFDGSTHGMRLALLAELGEDAPAWLVSRWLTLQARRPLSSGADGSARDDVFERVVEIAYPHGVETARMQGLSMSVFLAFLLERDWVMRQLVVYEDGGLRRLVRAGASRTLLARADDPEAWVQARMSGFRLGPEREGCLQVTDLGDGQVLDLVDLGLGFEHPPGQHVLGRVVPTRTSPGRMFEWRPLPVDGETAALVANDPERWTQILARQARSLELPCCFSLMDDDTDMLTDLPLHPWIGLLEAEQIGALPSEDGLISYDDVALVVLERLVVAFGTVGFVPSLMPPVLWSMLLQPGMDGAVRERLTGMRFQRGWSVIAEAVFEPAKSRCRDYAALCGAVAG